MGCSGGSREELCQFDTIPPMRYAAGYIGCITKKQGAPCGRTLKNPHTTETPVSLQHWSSWWARVDYASRAAKNSLAGCFCPAGRKAPGRSCSNPPAYVSLTFAQKKTASVSLHQRFFHGRGWIRTTEAEKQQIYSLSPLATREHAHIQFLAVADCLYILPLGGVFVNCFLQLFQKRS